MTSLNCMAALTAMLVLMTLADLAVSFKENDSVSQDHYAELLTRILEQQKELLNENCSLRSNITYLESRFGGVMTSPNVQELQRLVAKLGADLTDANNENQRLKNKMDQLQKNHEIDIQQLKMEHGRELARLKLEKQHLDDDISRLRKLRRDDLNDEIVKCKQDKDSLNYEIKNLTNECLILQKENLQYKFNTNELNQLITNSKQNLDTCNKQKEATNTELQNIKQEFQSHKSGCEQRERAAATKGQDLELSLSKVQEHLKNISGSLQEVTIKESCKTKVMELGMVNLNGRYYYVSDINLKKTWYDANFFCKLHSMDLVSIETAEEDNLILSHIEQRFGAKWSGFWLGGNDWGAEGQWMWSASGQPLTYKAWHTGQPDQGNSENCLVNYRPTGGRWHDNPVTNTWSFICEMRDSCYV